MFFLFGPLGVFAQKTKIYGSVLDASNNQRLPFVNVVFQGSNVGTVTDSVGNFFLETKRGFDSIQVSLIGYRPQSFAVVSGVTDEIDILLEPNSYELDEVKVRPGENPAFKILRKVIENKPLNTPERLDAYEYETYHRVRFDLNNFTEKAKKNLILRPFDYIWDNTDTTEDGVNYLPILLTESNEEYYFRKEPRTQKKVVKGERTFKFFKAPRIMEFVKDMYIDPNVYDNYVVILDRSFPSPINDYYKRNYNFVLDSGIHHIGGYDCHHIYFKPKGKSDVAFTGDMFIDTVSYALVQTDLEFSVEANVNFVRNYSIRQNYALVDGKQWFLSKSQVLADFTVIENAKDMTGFYGRKTTEVRNIRMNEPREKQFYSMVDPVIVQDSAYLRSEEFWETARNDTFSEKEQELVKMVNRMNEDRNWKLIQGTIRLLAEGWIEAGPVDIGNIWSTYSWNPIEESRVRLGFRTNDRFSKIVQLDGYGAYGFGDNRFKGGGNIRFIFRNDHYRKTILGGGYRNDLFQIGRSDNGLPLDHVIASLINLTRSQNRCMYENANMYLERQWFSGFSTRISAFRDTYSAIGARYAQTSESDTLLVPSYTAAGFKFSMRFGHGIADLSAKYEDKQEGLFAKKYPIVSFETAIGLKNLWKGQFSYQHIRIKMDYRANAKKWGHTDIMAEAGYINGQLPYVFLHNPFGNPLLINDHESFNLMNYMEFVSDRYGILQVEHHFDGLLFNAIPWVNKLKLRSFLVGKMYYGVLSKRNDEESPYLLADGMGKLQYPYYEVGFGIENILKIARIDFLWRLTRSDAPNVLSFIVKPSFYFRF